MTNYLQHMRERYGNDVALRAKKYMTCTQKLANLTSRRNFLLECRKYGLMPSHIINNFKCTFQLLAKNSPYNKEINSAVESFQKRILNAEIKSTHWEIGNVKRDRWSAREELLGFGFEGVAVFLSKQEDTHGKLIKHLSTIHKRKMDALWERQLGTKLGDHSAEWVTNLTDIPIPKEVNILLGYGPKFSLPFKTVPNHAVAHLLADVESTVASRKHLMSENDLNALRSRLANVMSNCLRDKKSKSAVDKYFLHLESKAVAFIREHPEIIIAKSDKGNRTTVMWRADYDSKMMALITAPGDYIEEKGDKTSGYERQKNMLVSTLHSFGYIDDKTRRTLTTYNAKSPAIYGLPKVHKAGAPLRPIVSCIQSPTHGLSQLLSGILRLVADQHQYNVRDSFGFVERIKSVVVPPEHVMVSFDVVSLFTNVPIELVEACVQSLWPKIRCATPIDETLFSRVLQFCLKTSYFVYKGKYYRQLKGVPMGGPLSPIAADIVMDHVLKSAADRLDFPLVCLTKYVDDIFCLIPEDKIDETLGVLNSINDSIKFTVEKERDGGLAYLDTFVLRRETSLDTLWYKKPSATPRMLNFLSKHPLQHKISVATGFIKRVVALTTTNLENVKTTIFAQLRINNYPPQLIRRLLQENLRVRSQTTQERQQEEVQYVSLTYVPQWSERLKQVLCRSFDGLCVSMKPANSAYKFYTHLKDKPPLLKDSYVVYNINCSCGRKYIGKTTQRLEVRIRQHKDSIRNNERKTALSTHAIENECSFDFGGTTVLDREAQHHKLLILEMIYIQTNRERAINLQSDTSKLGTVYAAIIQSMRLDEERRMRRREGERMLERAQREMERSDGVQEGDARAVQIGHQ
ncbi:uncharacterized protein LOC129795483 [Lutzomyia longipalpis]|uniref:uncharacterized protein LOC129795483 n=1 Tax=Lutzomyia longipalpis TaxID=7200 RepID=UPI00248463EF|nr:uncharacterized protein LOC129795483 [Lutzomyia longipalpis]